MRGGTYRRGSPECLPLEQGHGPAGITGQCNPLSSVGQCGAHLHGITPGRLGARAPCHRPVSLFARAEPRGNTDGLVLGRRSLRLEHASEAGGSAGTARVEDDGCRERGPRGGGGEEGEGEGDVMVLSGVFRSRGCCWVRAPGPHTGPGHGRLLASGCRALGLIVSVIASLVATRSPEAPGHERVCSHPHRVLNNPERSFYLCSCPVLCFLVPS